MKEHKLLFVCIHFHSINTFFVRTRTVARVAQTLLFTLQISISYLLMLAVMVSSSRIQSIVLWLFYCSLKAVKQSSEVWQQQDWDSICLKQDLLVIDYNITHFQLHKKKHIHWDFTKFVGFILVLLFFFAVSGLRKITFLHYYCSKIYLPV